MSEGFINSSGVKSIGINKGSSETKGTSDEKNLYSANELVPLALDYYDKLRDKYSKLFKKVYSDKTYPAEHDTAKNKIELMDKDGKILLTSSYEVVGIYNKLHKFWAWAWSVPELRKNNIRISRKILNYGLDLNEDVSYFLKSELITSRFRVVDKLQLDPHIAIASYLSKKMIYKYVFSPTQEDTSKNLIFYLYLNDLDVFI